MLVDITKLISRGLVLDIRYATTNNFTGVQLYSEPKCFLQEETARKLAMVVRKLSAKLMLGVKVFDGYRPLRVQRWLWEMKPDPNYVADPAVGSKHNRGAAVDLTLIDLVSGREMEMGTGYDDFTDMAHPDFKELPETTLNNRAVLREMMMNCGFDPITTEWWHFDDADWKNYDVLDVPFSALG